MPISLHTTLRNDRATQVNTFVGSGAKIRIYTTGYTTLLVELTGNATAFGSVSNGVLTLNAVTNGTASATGTAAVARIYKSDGTTLAIDGLTVGTSGANINLNSTSITSGGTVSITSGTITEGNA